MIVNSFIPIPLITLLKGLALGYNLPMLPTYLNDHHPEHGYWINADYSISISQYTCNKLGLSKNPDTAVFYAADWHKRLPRLDVKGFPEGFKA